MEAKVINILKEFAKFPTGRYKSDGPNSGERFRSEFLLPAYKANTYDRIIVELDGARGYGSSFLEEAFGGLVREGLPATEILQRLELRGQDESLKQEIRSYIVKQASVAASHA